MFRGGGAGGLPDSGGREGSEKGGMGSPLAGKDAGLCNDLGDECLSCGDKSANGRDEVDEVKGEGKLGCPETAVDSDGGNVGAPGFVPEMTSCIDGSDCRCGGSLSSGILRGSTGEIMPGMLELAAG